MSEELENSGAGNDQKPQYSEEFVEKMTSAQNAFGDLGQEGNTYDTGEKSEAFKFEESAPSNTEGEKKPDDGVQAVVAENQEGQKPEGEKADLIVEENAPTKAQEQSAEGEGEAVKFSSRMTGEIELDKKPEEAPASVGFESWDEFDKWSGEGEHGITKDNIREELPKLIEAKNSLEGATKENDNLKSVFENMPKELYESIRAWGGGEDWRSVIKNSDATDFNLDFSKQGSEEMVERYFPGKLTSEDWKEFSDKETGDEVQAAKVKEYIEMAEDKYGIDQTTLKQQTQEYSANAERVTIQRQESFDKSRENIANAFEGTSLTIDDGYISEVDKVAQSQQEVLNLFFNPDGTHKEDAHQRIAMAMDGRELVINQAKRMERQIVSKARQEVVAITPDSHSIKKTGDHGRNTELENSKAKVKSRVASIFGTPEEKIY